MRMGIRLDLKGIFVDIPFILHAFDTHTFFSASLGSLRHSLPINSENQTLISHDPNNVRVLPGGPGDMGDTVEACDPRDVKFIPH
jgi:hypothetical protein